MLTISKVIVPVPFQDFTPRDRSVLRLIFSTAQAIWLRGESLEGSEDSYAFIRFVKMEIDLPFVDKAQHLGFEALGQPTLHECIHMLKDQYLTVFVFRASLLTGEKGSPVQILALTKAAKNLVDHMTAYFPGIA